MNRAGKDFGSFQGDRSHLLLHFIQSIKRMIKYIADRFEELLKKNSEVTEGKVVVLIDEYDEPIIDHIEEQIHFCNS